MKPVLNEGVCFAATLPLQWQSGPALPSLEAARYLAVLAEFEQTREEAGGSSDNNAKLDLILLWLSRVLTTTQPVPCAAVLGLESLTWQSAQPQLAGSTGAVALNLSDALPFMLTLSAQIEACEQRGEIWQLRASLQFDDENLQDWWERTVFRRHRRMIRQERGGQA